MAFSLLGYLVLLLSLFFAVSAKNQNSEFTQKVRNMLPEKTFKKLFNPAHDNVEQFLRGLHNAEKEQVDVFKTPFPPSLADELTVDIKKYADMITPDSMFRIYMNAEGETLQAMGKMNNDNMDDMAEGVVKYLKDAVPSVKKDNIEETNPAVGTALVKFLKSQGLASSDVLKLFTKNILNNIRLEF